MNVPALVVDKSGLARKLSHKPKAFLIWELLQNALDEDGVTKITMTAFMEPGKPECCITVTDDCPEGFQDLASVYTLFRDSKKANDPTKRGRFELGEKLVIALAQYMSVETTKGTIIIQGDERGTTRKKSLTGSTITLRVKMSRSEFEEMKRTVLMFIQPHPESGPVITFNCQGFEPRKLLGQASVVLPTVVADEDGALKQVRRQTVVNVYPVLPGEVAHIYEMGIPVVETGDRWHYDVQQRVPVNWERDNVSKSYVKAVRTAVLDVMSKEITQEDAQSSWVQSSLDKAAPEAVQDVIKKQFGSRAVIYDPSDLEGSKLAVSKGYTVVHGGTFSRETWGNIRKSGALLPAGQVTPSPKAYSDDPDAPVEELLPREKWSEGMLKVEALIQRLGDHLLNSKVEVRYTLGNVGFAAAFGRGTSLLVSGATFTFNYRRLGRKWFDRDNRDEDLLSLIIHEFGHFYSGDHLAEEYHEALCDLGARMARLALKDPQIFSV